MCIGVFGDAESKGFPGAKTMVALGYQNNVSYRSLGLDAPGGTPQEIVDILDSAMQQIHTNPEVLKKADEASLVINYKDQKQYASHWDEETKKAQALMDDIKKSQ